MGVSSESSIVKLWDKFFGDPRNYGAGMLTVGLLLLIYLYSQRGESVGAIEFILICVALVLLSVGVTLMVIRARVDSDKIDTVVKNIDDAEDINRQLKQNYNSLRFQVIVAFIVSFVFFAVGLIVIIIGAIGNVFGLETSGVNLTTVAGVIVEFISGTALVIYRNSFKELNRSSSRLEENWNQLVALKEAKNLSDEQLQKDLIRKMGRVSTSS